MKLPIVICIFLYDVDHSFTSNVMVKVCVLCLTLKRLSSNKTLICLHCHRKVRLHPCLPRVVTWNEVHHYLQLSGKTEHGKRVEFLDSISNEQKVFFEPCEGENSICCMIFLHNDLSIALSRELR